VETHVLSFELSGRRFAVSLEHVREVLLPASVTPVPGAPAYVKGLVNARGVLAPALDLAVLQGEKGGAAPGKVVTPAGPYLIGSVVLLELPAQPWSDGQPVRAAVSADRVLGVVAAGAVGEGGATVLDVAALFARVRADVEQMGKTS
jgi:purine-binding chemotaxis protein CheW